MPSTGLHRAASSPSCKKRAAVSKGAYRGMGCGDGRRACYQRPASNKVPRKKPRRLQADRGNWRADILEVRSRPDLHRKVVWLKATFVWSGRRYINVSALTLFPIHRIASERRQPDANKIALFQP